MKKIIYSIFSVSVLLFASCSEDRGTTTEVVDANNDEYVKESNIRDFGDEIGKDVGAYTPTTITDYRNRSQPITNQMATDLQLDKATHQRVARIIAERERRLGELEGRYNFSETNRMGGQANSDTERDMNTNENLTNDPVRSNNTGNAYEEKSAMGKETASNMERNTAAMTSERKTIMAEADKELKGVLTADQYNNYVQNRDKYEMTGNMNSGSDNDMQMKTNEHDAHMGTHGDMMNKKK